MFFPKFVYMTKNTPFFSNFARFCTPKRCTRVQCLVLKTTLITWIFGRAWYPLDIRVAPRGCHVCRAVKIPIFGTAVTWWPQNWWLSLNERLFVFLSICHPKPVIVQFQQIFKWFSLHNLNIRCFYGTGTALTKRAKMTFSPNAPIILDKNAVSHPVTPYFCKFFSHSMPLDEKTSAYTYIDFIYECFPPPQICNL